MPTARAVPIWQLTVAVWRLIVRTVASLVVAVDAKYNTEQPTGPVARLVGLSGWQLDKFDVVIVICLLCSSWNFLLVNDHSFVVSLLNRKMMVSPSGFAKLGYQFMGNKSVP